MSKMKVILSNKLIVERPNKLLKVCLRNDLSASNPSFVQAERDGRCTRHLDPEIICFERIGDSLLVPYGYLGKLAYLQKRYELSFSVTDRTVVPGLPEPVKLGRGLYQYQAAAVEAVTSRRCGSLVAPMKVEPPF